MQTASGGTGSNWQPWMSHISNQSAPKPEVDLWAKNLLRYQFAAININNGNIIPSTVIPPNPNSRRRIEDPNKDKRRNVIIPESMQKIEITEANLDTLLSIEMPPTEGQSEEKIMKERVHHMIYHRKRKMKKHQRRKWLVEYAFSERKLKLRKAKRLEKEMHAEILTQIREAEEFSAEQYVEDKLAKLNAPTKKIPKIISIW